MVDNFILLTDSYKNSHAQQYRRGTTSVRSYLEPRIGGRWPEVVPFGYQYFLKQYFTKPITTDDIDEAESYFLPHMGSFDRSKWKYIVDKHGGYLPLSIRAVPEGYVIPTGHPLMVVVNTDPKCYWLTNYAETVLVESWYPTTVATQSREMKKILLRHLEHTGDPSLLGFKLHDFGFRGVEGPDAAALGGAAHLVNFFGTDTVPALKLCRETYNEWTAGYSIPASEHSTITSWGEVNEVDAYRNMIRQYGDSTYACVSDSYDLLRACTELWGGVLKEEVLAANGTLVVRPDSGNPHVTVPAVLQALWTSFGGTVNEKGYKVLHPKVRVIQGDGIDIDSLGTICQAIDDSGFSLDNVAFGSGGGLLQKVNRDTMRFAFKCCETTFDGHTSSVAKRPVTDPSKASKSGHQEPYLTDNGVTTGPFGKVRGVPIMREIFRNGELLVYDTLAEIRERAAL